MNSDSKKSNVRLIAIEILDKVEHQGFYSNLAIDQALRTKDIYYLDQHLLTELVYGVLQRKLTLDFYIDHFLNQKMIESWVRQNLRLAFYQFIYLDRIPAHAIVHETVEIAKERGHRGIAGLVNGVLRSLQREGVPPLEHISQPLKRLSITYSLPEWLVGLSLKRLGKRGTIAFAQSLNNRPRMSVRVNLSQISRLKAISELREEGIVARASQIFPFGIIIEKGKVQSSSLFEQGYLTIQDESSMLVAPALNVDEDHYVLDACSAPGGKTTHIASEYLNPLLGGKVLALDLYPNKIKKIERNAIRQNVADCVHAKQMDSRQIVNEFQSPIFDRILVDAPCSGLGLMRRKPEIRYNKSYQDLLSLRSLQIDILTAVAQTLKPGGELIYSTCTFTQEENEQVIQIFLDAHPDFKQISIDQLPPNIKYGDHKTLTIYPHEYGTDGFSISRLIRQ